MTTEALWRCEEDPINPRYRRVYFSDADVSIARVYDPRNAAAITAAPELLAMVVDVANGKTVTTSEAAKLARRAGVV